VVDRGGRRRGRDDPARNSTQKPVEAMRRPIVNDSARGDVVYEPFCGSGMTLIAAETVGRTFLAMELDPGYCDVVVKRWEAFTGSTQLRNESSATTRWRHISREHAIP
jgi:DNA modification methylase